MCGVRACENMQKRVSHGETVRVGSSVLSVTVMEDHTVVHSHPVCVSPSSGDSSS